MSYEPLNVAFIELFPGGITMNALQSSAPYLLDGVRGYCVQVIWSGASAADGSVYLQVSNDGINFDTIPESVLAVSGSSGINTMNVYEVEYKWVQLVYAPVDSMNGTMVANLNAKR
jgi:hypothetical protein